MSKAYALDFCKNNFHISINSKHYSQHYQVQCIFSDKLQTVLIFIIFIYLYMQIIKCFNQPTSSYVIAELHIANVILLPTSCPSSP